MTKRCLLTTPTDTDLDNIIKLYSNKKVRKYLGGIRDVESVISTFSEMTNSNDFAHFRVISLIDSNRFIGMVSLDQHHNRLDIEVSYQFLPEYWGKGYAFEVVSEMIRYGFKNLRFPRIVAETQTANQPSIKLLEKLGMQLQDIYHRFGTEQALYVIESYKVD